MKRTKTMSTLLSTLALAVMTLLTVSSCQKNEIFYEDVSGILTWRFQLPDGRVFNCEVDQPGQKIENNQDSLLFGTSQEVLSGIIPVFTTTLGAKVFVDGNEIKSGESSINLTSPLTIKTEYNGAVREYNVNAFVEKKDHSQTSGAKINTDMRMTGLPSFNSYSAAWFNDKLYIMGAYYPGGTSTTATAYYELYSSPDGGKWTKVETAPEIIGSFGVKLIALNNKLFAIGGMRAYGKYINGAANESSAVWKIFSTTDGANWTDCTPGSVNAPSGRTFPQVTVHNGALYLRRGKMFGFGMWQNVNQSTIYKTTDGTNWTIIAPNATLATNRTEDAMFSFNNKLWIAGGYANWISESNVKNDIWYSENDGVTWVQATAASGEDLKRFGHSVVSYGGKLYMIGGEKIVGSAREGITSVLTSTDGINWTKLPLDMQLPVSFTKRIYSNVFMGQDDLIWIIGGFAGSAGNYSISGINMDTRYDVWTKRLK
ncbi:MAG: hypothetical protein PHT63_00210 [Bacteroidales bacterium]|nr:hypothetical protein [Bacteroidales bacterium]